MCFGTNTFDTAFYWWICNISIEEDSNAFSALIIRFLLFELTESTFQEKEVDQNKYYMFS